MLQTPRKARMTFLATCVAAALSACTEASPPSPPPAAGPAPLSGERLAYVVGCVNCHHQTPKEIMNAPSLVVAQSYSLQEFSTLLNTGRTRGGRDLYAEGSIMGIVAREQLSHMTGDEVAAVHRFLQGGWTPQRVAEEEAKIATFPAPSFQQQ